MSPEERPLFLSSYHAGWAFRLLREARVDFHALERARNGGEALRYYVNMVEKLRRAVYCALGEPFQGERALVACAREKRVHDDPVARFLLRLVNESEGAFLPRTAAVGPLLPSKAALVKRAKRFLSAVENLIRALAGDVGG